MLSNLKIVKASLSRISYTGLRKIRTRGILFTSHFKGPLKIAVLNLHFPSQAKSIGYREKSIAYLTRLAKRLRRNHSVVIAAGDFNLTNREYKTLEKMINKDWATTRSMTRFDRGTYYYRAKKQWSHFDMIWVYRSSKCVIIPKSVRIIRLTSDYPKSFDGRRGSSDHFPIKAEILCQT